MRRHRCRWRHQQQRDPAAVQGVCQPGREPVQPGLRRAVHIVGAAHPHPGHRREHHDPARTLRAQPRREPGQQRDLRDIVGVHDRDRMPGAQFFPDARLNFAENVLRQSGSAPALIFNGENKRHRTISHDELRSEVARFASALRAAGIEAGDRVGGYIPNLPEAIIAALGAASIGATMLLTTRSGKGGNDNERLPLVPALLDSDDSGWRRLTSATTSKR